MIKVAVVVVMVRAAVRGVVARGIEIVVVRTPIGVTVVLAVPPVVGAVLRTRIICGKGYSKQEGESQEILHFNRFLLPVMA